MVNNATNISAYPGQLPRTVGHHPVDIDGGPLYTAEKVLNILARGETGIKLLTPTCRRDVQQLGFDLYDVNQLIVLALKSGQYLKSQWCLTGQTSNGESWAACDSYRVWRDESSEHLQKSLGIDYYVKFAIGKQGLLLLVVSCHLSR